MRFPLFGDVFLPAVEAGMMLAEAQLVIGLRMAGMAGFWPMPPQEAYRMVAEKVEASQAAMQAAMAASLGGGSVAQVASAAIAPYRKRTRANARRLTKMG